MLWDVWVLDFIEMTSEIVLESVSFEDAVDFTSSWQEIDSLAVTLPVGFFVSSN